MKWACFHIRANFIAMPFLSVDILIAIQYQRHKNHQWLEYIQLWFLHIGKYALTLSIRLLQVLSTINFMHSRSDKRQGKESLTSNATWSTSSTRSVSSASIVIKIDTDYEMNECSPLLATQGQNGRPYYPDYGLRSEQNFQRQHEQEVSTFLQPNNNGTDQNKYSSMIYNYDIKRYLCTIRLFGVLSIFISGLIIATYLMIIESRLPTLSFTLDLVNHDIWSGVPIPVGSLLNHSSFLNVILLHTGGTNCVNSVSCINTLKQMQYQQTSQIEMPYNFLVADDGQTYEVRGWDHTSGYRSVPPETQDTSLVIGFIGNYTKIAPNEILLQSAISLIKESVRRKKLLREYRVYGIRNVTVADNDADALFRYIANWLRFEKLLDVL